ncbi:MAG: hypothetical protein DLM72_06160 [Candidatus Nitrosopolaris wilkensis]|nr:MAG: hypothetical protein DLM72_06160 [Candidatus Nitrosopolaris wilkensis]
MYASNLKCKSTNDYNEKRMVHAGWIENLAMNPGKLIQKMYGFPLSKEWRKARRMNRLNQELYDLL